MNKTTNMARIVMASVLMSALLLAAGPVSAHTTDMPVKNVRQVSQRRHVVMRRVAPRSSFQAVRHVTRQRTVQRTVATSSSCHHLTR